MNSPWRTVKNITHISGPGCSLYGDAPISPMLGAPQGGRVYQESYSHTGERSEPGYYEVKLDSGIQVRLAAHLRSGAGEFQFPAGDAKRTLTIDLGHNLEPRDLRD